MPTAKSPKLLDKEIKRLQGLLAQLDQQILERKQDISLKELSQAVHTAGDGGRSIAQLRKVAKELEAAMQDEDTQHLKDSLLALLDRLGERRTRTRAGAPPSDPGSGS